jgi:hypothetical protein
MLRMLRTLPFALVLAALSMFAASCGSSNSKLRLMHAVPDGGAIDVLIDGKNVAPGLSFDIATSYLSVTSGSRHVQVFAAGTTTNAFFDGTVSLSGGTTYTAVATGSATSSTVVAPLFTDNNTAPTSGNIEIRVIHASPTWNTDFGGLDVYVVAPGTSISGVSPTISNLTYKNASTYLSVAAGQYEIVMTPVGQKSNDIDIEPSDLNTAGRIRTFVVVDNAGGGLSGTPQELSDLN